MSSTGTCLPDPHGSTTQDDWVTLGKVTALIQDRTGFDIESDEEDSAIIIPIADNPPDATIHWAWHSDSSPIDPVALAMLREVVAKVGGNPLARVKALRSLIKTRIKPKVPRNAPCPCGSGKKHKKCCLLN